MLVKAIPQLARSGENKYYVLLKDQNSDRRLIMIIEETSFLYLAEAVNKKSIGCRPANQALADLLRRSDLQLDRLIVYDIVDRIFVSKMIIGNLTGMPKLAININVIDGIIVAILLQRPIFIDETVFHKSDELEKKDNEEFFENQAREEFDQLDTKNSTKM